MKAMILAAGRGERMRPLTDTTPKPLLEVGGKPLIVHTLEQLKNAGFDDIVINIAHLGGHIMRYLGDGAAFGVAIRYSDEGEQALETAGGIINALPLLGSEPFLVVNGDIASDFAFETLKHKIVDLAHLVLVGNPEHHPDGDFGLDENLRALVDSPVKYTFSGIGIYRPDLFDGVKPGKVKLAPLLRQAMQTQRVTGEIHRGFWLDVGTPDRLQALDHYYSRGKYHEQPCL